MPLTIADVRQKYPQYNGLSDDQLAGALHKKYYASMPYEEFTSKIGLSAQAQQKEPEKSLMQKADELIPAPIGEAAAAINRGVVNTVDFLASPVEYAIGAVKEGTLSPQGDYSIRGALKDTPLSVEGNFMKDGLAKDVIRKGGEFVGPGGAGGVILRAAAKTLPAVTAGETVATGALRQAGSSTTAQDAAQSALAGVGAASGGKVGEAIGGETGKQVGEFAGALLAPLSAAYATNVAAKTINSQARKILQSASPTTETLKDASRAIYKQIDDLGAKVDQAGMANLSKTLESEMRQHGFSPRIHPKIDAALQEFKSAGNSAQALTEVEILRRVAGSAARSTDPDEARLGTLLVQQVDDFMGNLSQQNLVGGDPAKVGALYKDARQLWSRASKAEIIEHSMNRAQLMASGAENGLRNEFRSLLKNKKYLKTFTEEERAAMKQVVDGGTIRNTLKALGKFGISEDGAIRMLIPGLGTAAGAAVGGPIGAAAVPMAGQVARMASRKMTEKSAEKALNIVRSGKTGQEIAVNYVKSIPQGERSVEDLTKMLLSRPDVSLESLLKISSQTKTHRMISDAAYMANVIRSSEGSKAANAAEERPTTSSAVATNY